MRRTYLLSLSTVLLACHSVEPDALTQTASNVGAFEDSTLWQSSAGGTVEAGDRHGRTLATGDFNGDGYPDLASSSTLEDDGAADAGLVIVFYGGAGGVGSGGTERLNQSSVRGQRNEEGDRFGRALAAGDFDGDGLDDLAIGIPHKDIGAESDAGMVAVFFGSRSGLLPARTEVVSQDTVRGPVSEAGDRFGWALAAGDFDRDGYDDLAIGTPGEDLHGVADAGNIVVLFGASGGLLPARAEAFNQDRIVAVSNEAGDELGYALAAGDFDRDGYDDLAIGAPGKSASRSVTESGLVAVMYGASTGLLPARSESFTQNSVVDATNEAGDRFGEVLATGDMNGDGYADLAIGIPYENRNGVSDTGLVAIMYGQSTGLIPSLSESVAQYRAYGTDSRDDHFGAALVAADFDADGFDDLVVGTPDEDDPDHTDNGLVFVFFGSDRGVLPARSYYLRQASFGGVEENGDRFGAALAAADFDQDGRVDLAVGAPKEDLDGLADVGAVYSSALEPALPELRTTRTAIVIDANTAEVYGAKQPDVRRAIASTTKIMTALLTIEALNRGEIGRMDMVTVSRNAASIYGSRMFVDEGDQVTVRDLLFGLMLPSGNDAAIVLAEYVAGSEAAFVDRMNIRAAELGLTNTSFRNPHGLDPCSTLDFDRPRCAHYSTARDLAMLARFALSDPLFARVVRTEYFMPSSWRDASGLRKPDTWTDEEGTRRFKYLCNTNKRLRDGTASCGQSAFYEPNTYGVKTGTTHDAQACLVSASTRNRKDVIAVVLGADRDTDDRYEDMKTVFDFGFQRAPTELLGSGGLGGL